jgi:hypothetical protein
MTEMSIDFLSQDGFRMIQIYSRHMGSTIEIPPGELRVSVRLDSLPLVPGYYPAYLWIGTGNTPVHFLRNSLTLRVEPGSYGEGEVIDNRGFPVVLQSHWETVLKDAASDV